MRFMVFSVGLSVRFDNARRQQRANVQDKKRAKQDTGADGAREKNTLLLSEYCCASRRHQSCQIEVAETSVHHPLYGAALSQATACLYTT
jgi:hypothetical protein